MVIQRRRNPNRRRQPVIIKRGRRRPVKINARQLNDQTNRLISKRLKQVKKAANQPIVSRTRSGVPATSDRRGKPSIIRGPRLTQHGMSFLKCAFAPPDFTDTQVSGVPDDFRGLTLLKRHRLTQSVTLAAGNDYYFLLAPMPGFAFFVMTLPTGVAPVATDFFLGTEYSDYLDLFGVDGNSIGDIVSSFRYISNHIELISTTNQMTYSGSISVMKIPIKFAMRGNGRYTITGLQSVNSSNCSMYTGASIDGVYSGAYNIAPDFEFTPMLEAQPFSRIPEAITPADFITLQGVRSVTGFDNNFESVLIRVSGLSTTNTFMVKTWACVEYTALNNSSVYEYQRISPPCDDIAMRIYREVALSLPIAVPVRENSNFWNRVITIIRSITAAGSYVPGPVGMVSGGVNSIIRGLQSIKV